MLAISDIEVVLREGEMLRVWGGGGGGGDRPTSFGGILLNHCGLVRIAITTPGTCIFPQNAYFNNWH